MQRWSSSASLETIDIVSHLLYEDTIFLLFSFFFTACSNLYLHSLYQCRGSLRGVRLRAQPQSWRNFENVTRNQAILIKAVFRQDSPQRICTIWLHFSLELAEFCKLNSRWFFHHSGYHFWMKDTNCVLFVLFEPETVLIIVDFVVVDIFYSKFQVVSTFFICSEFCVENNW